MSSQHTYPRPPTATTSIIAPLSPPTRQQTAGLIVVPEHEVIAVAHHAALMRRSAPHESRSRCSRLAAHVGRVCTFRKWSARLPCHALPLLIGVAMTQQLRPSSARAASLRRISRRGRRAEPRRRKCDGRSSVSGSLTTIGPARVRAQISIADRRTVYGRINFVLVV